jgi:hypothetical protein
MRLSSAAFLMGAMFISGCTGLQAPVDRAETSPATGEVRTSRFGSDSHALLAARDAAGTNGCVVVDNAITINATTDLGDTPVAMRGGAFEDGGGKLVIRNFSPNASRLARFFSPKLDVSLNGVPCVFSEWWGAKANSSGLSHDAINAALRTGLNVQLLKGVYQIAEPISYTTVGQGITGAGDSCTVLRWAARKGTYMVLQPYSYAKLTMLTLDGKDAEDLGGIHQSPDRDTYNQTLENVRIWACRGIGINGVGQKPGAAGPALVNDNVYRKVQVSYSSVGVELASPNQDFSACIIDHCQTGLLAIGNVKANFHGGVFSCNGWDICMSADFIACHGTWFENSKKGILTHSREQRELYAATFMGCLFHTYTKEHVMDLRAFTRGNLTIIGCAMSGTTTSKSFVTSPGISLFAENNRGFSKQDFHEAAAPKPEAK